MLAHHFKNFLTLLYKLTDIITIYCKNENELILNSLDEKSFTLLYHFEFKSLNSLRVGSTYIINLADIHKLFKYVKASSTLCFSINSCNLLCIEILLLGESIKQELLFPIIYAPANLPGGSETMIYYDDFISKPTVNIKVSDLSRIIKSLKNTADIYSLSFSEETFHFKNIEAVIPITYSIQILNPVPVVIAEPLIINNYTLLRLTKLYSDNSYVNIGRNFISSESDGVKYYISFLPEVNSE